jgi:hypothetical protein
VVGNETVMALPPTKVVAKHEILSILEKFLPGEGENLTPAPLPADAITLVQEVMCKAYKAVGCAGYARIDWFYQTAQQSPTGSERVVILEFNTLPGMTPATCIFHQAAELGIKPMEFIDRIVELGFQLHKKEHVAQIPQEQTSLLSLSEPVQQSSTLYDQEVAEQIEQEIVCDQVTLKEQPVAAKEGNDEGLILTGPVDQEDLVSRKQSCDEFIIKMF